MSKIPFREYKWTGPYNVEKVLPNENYIVRKLNSNKTQILHRIRLRKYESITVLQDIRPEGNLQPDDEIPEIKKGTLTLLGIPQLLSELHPEAIGKNDAIIQIAN